MGIKFAVHAKESPRHGVWGALLLVSITADHSSLPFLIQTDHCVVGGIGRSLHGN